MDGLPADIHGRQPRRRQHHRLLQRVEDQLTQKRGLSRARPAREKHVAMAADDLVDKRRIHVGGRLGAHPLSRRSGAPDAPLYNGFGHGLCSGRIERLMSLTPEQLERYARHIMLREIGGPAAHRAPRSLASDRLQAPGALGHAAERLHREAAAIKLRRADYRPGRDDGPIADHLVLAGAPAEGQPLGVGLSYGGPYLGIFCCKQQYVHKIAGRVVGLTRDLETLGESLDIFAALHAEHTGADRTRITIEQEMRRIRAEAKATAEAVGQEMKAAGLSDEAVRLARQRILGIAE